jgi:hypothetical protein
MGFNTVGCNTVGCNTVGSNTVVCHRDYRSSIDVGYLVWTYLRPSVPNDNGRDLCKC